LRYTRDATFSIGPPPDSQAIMPKGPPVVGWPMERCCRAREGVHHHVRFSGDLACLRFGQQHGTDNVDHAIRLFDIDDILDVEHRATAPPRVIDHGKASRQGEGCNEKETGFPDPGFLAFLRAGQPRLTSAVTRQGRGRIPPGGPPL